MGTRDSRDDAAKQGNLLLLTEHWRARSAKATDSNFEDCNYR